VVADTVIKADVLCFCAATSRSRLISLRAGGADETW
jgi:hypothetical protein